MHSTPPTNAGTFTHHSHVVPSAKRYSAGLVSVPALAVERSEQGEALRPGVPVLERGADRKTVSEQNEGLTEEPRQRERAGRGMVLRMHTAWSGEVS